MIDYSQWQRKKLQVKSLKLDDANPRLSGFGNNIPNQTQVIEYMLEYEKVIPLAKDISKIGYLPNEEPIVFKEKNRYVVLEGNRRVTACKVLVEPDLIPKKSNKHSAIKRMLLEFNSDFVRSLTVIIAPSREAADILIVNRHTDGSAIERWDKTKQDRFFYNKFADGLSIDEISTRFNIPKGAIKDSLTRFEIFSELQKLPLNLEEKQALADETKFSITNVERVFKSKRGRDFLGITITSSGNLFHNLPKEEYVKRLSKITSDVVSGKLNSRTYGDDKLAASYLAKFANDPDINKAIVPSKSFEEEYSDISNETEETAETQINLTEEKPETISNLNTTAPQNKLIPPIASKWNSGNVRIDKIFKELKEANLNDQFNSTAILFRSYLDMVVYQFLQKKGQIHELMKLEQQKSDAENDKKLARVKKYMIDSGFLEDNINENDLAKALGLKSGVSGSWVPSLRQMLVHITSSDELLPDVKLKQALIQYIKGHEDYLGHHDFNLLVHNEYYTNTKKELKQTWEKLYPILQFINSSLNSK